MTPAIDPAAHLSPADRADIEISEGGSRSAQTLGSYTREASPTGYPLESVIFESRIANQEVGVPSPCGQDATLEKSAEIPGPRSNVEQWPITQVEP